MKHYYRNVRDALKAWGSIVISTVLAINCLLFFVLSVKSIIMYVPPYVITQERVQQIYDSLYLASGEDPKSKLPIAVIDAEDVNAYAYSGGMVVFTGLATVIHNDDELALVIGHELAHITLSHVYGVEGTSEDVIRHHEGLADKLGAFYMMKAGYDVCHGKEFFHTLKGLGAGEGGSHPMHDWRYNQLDVNCSK